MAQVPAAGSYDRSAAVDAPANPHVLDRQAPPCKEFALAPAGLATVAASGAGDPVATGVIESLARPGGNVSKRWGSEESKCSREYNSRCRIVRQKRCR
jgi:hypothetical protein